MNIPKSKTLDLDVCPSIGKHFHNMECELLSRKAWKRLYGRLRYLRRNFRHHKYALFETTWEGVKPVSARECA